MEELVMIRYGRVSGNPKNTLFTVRRGNIIYFGISRCNPKFDTFRKMHGKFVAGERAYVAIEEVGNEANITDLTIHKSGLRGACNRENVIKMLQYFDNLEQNMRTRHDL